MGDNGKPIESKTEEQLASERLSRYQKEPHSFIEVSEIIVCEIRSEKGPMIMIRGNVFELKMALADIMIGLPETIKKIQEDQRKANEPKIMTPQKHGILNFARRK